MSKQARAKKRHPDVSGPQGVATSLGDRQPKDQSPRIFQREKIDFDLHVRTRPDLTEKQKEFIDLVMDKKTKLVFVDGPAGTSKTFLAVMCGLMLIQKRSVSDLLYVRSIAESASKSLGSLPGIVSEKMDPFLMPLHDKLDELLSKAEINALVKQDRVSGMPINYVRGASFNARFVIADESQNFDTKELTTLITRLGQFSKMVVAGDHNQSDINGRSGFMKMFDLFNDESSRNEGIYCFSFTRADIVRSGILRYIVERVEGQILPPSPITSPENKSMFPPHDPLRQPRKS